MSAEFSDPKKTLIPRAPSLSPLKFSRPTTASPVSSRNAAGYAQWGVQDILVFDPIEREAWYWDTVSEDLTRIKDNYSFRSHPAELNLTEIFRRPGSEL